MTQPFLARGEEELKRELDKLPWACYLHMDHYSQFKAPQTKAKTHKSKLFHEKMVREILLSQINDLPIKRAWRIHCNKFVASTGTRPTSFQNFKKQWLKEAQAKEKQELVQAISQKEIEAGGEDKVVLSREGRFTRLDSLRQEYQTKAAIVRSLKQPSKIQINIIKDRAEVLVGTSYEGLHKHGFKPYMRWGVLNETLAAACILESGILERARRTGKLHVWDPFCGSGSFLIELLMMALDRPCRDTDKQMPFELWPIHDAPLFE